MGIAETVGGVLEAPGQDVGNGIAVAEDLQRRAEACGFNGSVVCGQRTPKRRGEIQSKDQHDRHESGKRYGEAAELPLWGCSRTHWGGKLGHCGTLVKGRDIQAGSEYESGDVDPIQQ
jgi:hypothetical protein